MFQNVAACFINYFRLLLNEDYNNPSAFSTLIFLSWKQHKFFVTSFSENSIKFQRIGDELMRSEAPP